MRGTRAEGETIRRLRKAQGLTQEDLAELAGCDVKTVRSAERAKNLDLCTLGRIAAALQVTFGEIAHGLDDAPAEVQARVAVVKQFWAAFNARDHEGMLDLCHDDVVMRLPGAPEIPFAGEYRGKDEVRRMNQAAFDAAAVEPITTKNVTFSGCGDCVFVHGTVEMTSKANGVVALLKMTHVFRLEGLKIIELEGGYDSLEMNKVLKAPPVEGEPG